MDINVSAFSDGHIVTNPDELRSGNVYIWEDVNVPTIMSEYHPVLDVLNVSPESSSHHPFI
jgi:hypothetical protein